MLRTHPTRWVWAPVGVRVEARDVWEVPDWSGLWTTSCRLPVSAFGQDARDRRPSAMMHTAMTAMATKYPLAVPRPAL